MIIVFIDGLVEPINPGGVATYGFVIYNNETKLLEKFGVIGKGPLMSNNLAEYYALYEALKFLIENKLNNEEIIVKSDSQLLVNQMNGLWKIKGGLYYPIYKKVSNFLKKFLNIKFIWIPREQNIEADLLSRKAYEEWLKKRNYERSRL
ncbi:MAG: ribonuclease HI [Candidatus Methanomethylicaceae archaeon]